MNGEKRVLPITISEVEEQLKIDKFQRAQRSFIVNMDKIEKIEGNMIYLKGDFAKSIICGTEYKNNIKNYIQERMLKSQKIKYKGF